jgi:hypothetical protein
VGQYGLGGVAYAEADDLCLRMGRRIFFPPPAYFRKEIPRVYVRYAGIPLYHDALLKFNHKAEKGKENKDETKYSIFFALCAFAVSMWF